MGHLRARLGSKYEATKTLSRPQVAALIRKDLVAATKAGDLPKGAKYRVTCSRGRGIDVRITPPDGVLILNPDYIAENLRNPRGATRDYPRYREAAIVWRDRVHLLVNAYNYDDSDPSTEYFNVRFYEDVQFAHAAESVEHEAIVIILSRHVHECMILHDLLVAERAADALALALKLPDLTRRSWRGDEVLTSHAEMAAALLRVIAARIANLPAPTIERPRGVLSPSACRPLAPFPRAQ
jgi:hypothetical protein